MAPASARAMASLTALAPKRATAGNACPEQGGATGRFVRAGSVVRAREYAPSLGGARSRRLARDGAPGSGQCTLMASPSMRWVWQLLTSVGIGIGPCSSADGRLPRSVRSRAKMACMAVVASTPISSVRCVQPCTPPSRALTSLAAKKNACRKQAFRSGRCWICWLAAGQLGAGPGLVWTVRSACCSRRMI
ncbi:hypothetical protein D9M72_560320 [compost metagenome]